jgi:hypothetical protein
MQVVLPIPSSWHDWGEQQDVPSPHVSGAAWPHPHPWSVAPLPQTLSHPQLPPQQSLSVPQLDPSAAPTCPPQVLSQVPQLPPQQSLSVPQLSPSAVQVGPASSPAAEPLVQVDDVGSQVSPSQQDWPPLQSPS